MTVRVDELDEFLRDLRQVADDEPKEMRKAYRKIANRVQSKARSNATKTAGPFSERYRDAKNAIRGFSDANSAAVGVSRSGSNPHAQATFWGTRGRSGWYAAAKYSASQGEQHPEWVGSGWKAGVPGEGPYVLNYTVAEERDEIVDEFGGAMDELFGKAFNK